MIKEKSYNQTKTEDNQQKSRKQFYLKTKKYKNPNRPKTVKKNVNGQFMYYFRTRCDLTFLLVVVSD